MSHDDWKSGIDGATKSAIIMTSAIFNIMFVHPFSIGGWRALILK